MRRCRAIGRKCRSSWTWLRSWRTAPPTQPAGGRPSAFQGRWAPLPGLPPPALLLPLHSLRQVVEHVPHDPPRARFLAPDRQIAADVADRRTLGLRQLDLVVASHDDRVVAAQDDVLVAKIQQLGS